MNNEKITLLNPEQEQFVVNYTSKGDFYNNAVLSYADAYGYDLKLREDGKTDWSTNEYKTCNANACRLIQKDNIKARIQAIYLERFNDQAVDSRISEIVNQGKDADAIQAVKVYNDLKQRITKKLDITSAGRPLAGLTDDELHALAE